MFIGLTLSVDIDNAIINKASNDQNSYMSKGHSGIHFDVDVPQPVPPVEYCERRGVLIDFGLPRCRKYSTLTRREGSHVN
jgi:hypothetical protein